MNFGIMFFSSVSRRSTAAQYELLLNVAQYTDAQHFCCIWTPERHFNDFGGHFPNPSVISAALATTTRNLQLRAGSLISPLHDPLRIAEEWSVVDNLSNGRVAISFGSGWNANDFVFFPEHYEARHKIMYKQIETVKNLWKGGFIERRNGTGKNVCVQLYPRPVQRDLPIWLTSSGNVDTIKSAGAIGANLLTHLIGQDIESLAEKIQLYREARAVNGFDPDTGIVSLMLHTFLGPDLASVKAQVKAPFCEYLYKAIGLERMAAMAGGVISGSHQIDVEDLSADMVEQLVEITFERYLNGASLIGTPTHCRKLIEHLQEIGVNEIACLIDFIENPQLIMKSLEYLSEFSSTFDTEALNQSRQMYVNNFIQELN